VEAVALPAVGPVKLIWFGRSDNIQTLLAALPGLVKMPGIDRCRLTVVADLSDGLRETISEQAAGIALELIEWSPNALRVALARAHVALLPGDDDPAMLTKSANRMQEAFWAGCLPVAYPTDSYQPFADMAVLDPDIAAGLATVLASTEQMVERTWAGQALVANQFTAAAVAETWITCLSDLRARPDELRPDPLTRLNLGCGEKLLAGYINVDIATDRGGVAPDVNCDLHDLSQFETESVDEILAIHTIEHFWRWEVVAILSEWARILRPGGKMVLECPNLKTACEAFLADPDAGSAPDARGQETMWAFYGDPNWSDSLMSHRWCYTPASLGAVMQEAGLDRISQQPAQFKFREPRDMRVVGVKPG
jgi:SAM-dependent methyltransferase